MSDLHAGTLPAKITACALPFFTLFLSLIWLRTSFKVQGTQTIPASKVTSVQTKKDGAVNTLVTVITSGDTIEFRTSHDKAKAIKETLTGIVAQAITSARPTVSAVGAVLFALSPPRDTPRDPGARALPDLRAGRARKWGLIATVRR